MTFLTIDYMSQQLNLRDKLLEAAANRDEACMLKIQGEIEWSPQELADLVTEFGYDYLILGNYNTKLAVEAWGPDWHRTDHTQE